MTTNKKRLMSMDVLAGIMILYMVIMHVMQWAELQDTVLFYNLSVVFGCFMPWFFFKGGIFFKHNSNTKLLIGGMKRLLLPYAIWSIVGFIVLLLCEINTVAPFLLYPYIMDSVHGVVFGGAVSGNLALWFLPTLFSVRLLFNIELSLEKVLATKYNKIYRFMFLGFITTLCLLAPYCLNLYDLHKPLWAANIFTGLFFFSIGYMIKNLQYNKYVVFTALVITILLCGLFFSNVDMRTNELTHGIYLVWPIQALASIVTYNNLFRLMEIKSHWVMNTQFVTFLSWCGRNSLHIYVIHWPILVIIFAIIK